MSAEPLLDTLVVGAGLGGLACAHDLQAAGERVRVLDKSRGVSGRASTRRLPLEGGPEARLDHGARFFTARHERTRDLAAQGVQAGWLGEWARGFARWEGGALQEARPDGHPRYAPLDGMSALGRHLAGGLDVQTGVTVTRLERQDGGWQVWDAAGPVARARRLVLNLPAPQLGPLLSGAGQDTPGPVEYAPAWAVGAVLGADLRADWPALELRGHPALEWIAREHTKRRPGHPPALMLHATADWSAANLERAPGEIVPELLDAAREVLGEKLDVLETFAHRWRYATLRQRVPAPGHWDAALGLGLCGDGFTPDDHGPRVEAALLSGWWVAAQATGRAP